MFLNYVSFCNTFKAKSDDGFKINTVEFDTIQIAFLVNFSNDIDENTIAKKSQFQLDSL